jgi:hypothetical protein
VPVPFEMGLGDVIQKLLKFEQFRKRVSLHADKNRGAVKENRHPFGWRLCGEKEDFRRTSISIGDRSHSVCHP